ncbi:uncharacterized protein PHALS_00361 [Plasmopara halstedii]|uniref:Uncharacterized protein n=1 Tax=Plasmopara halstedii TaxID=4781 RepID=A0A0P1A7D0_PLAHL|nr:uncharacterized protein PHALS_00361 [Plasmopara halstedii]CEG36040.1 hypothetical protein PHALS_00361 [Plasmopara halstedii]|eukprot:XP_024572409.1 hypothetical protein PHALS_00361 [Plasmopara halstedii]
MARLGLSDSMRSTTSIDEIGHQHSASPPQPLRRPWTASKAKVRKLVNEQKFRKKTLTLLFLNPLRLIVGGVLAILVQIGASKIFGATMQTWVGNHVSSDAQFERMDKSIDLLGGDTWRLQTTANRFLQSCQEVRSAASSQSKVFQLTFTRNFDDKVKTQIAEHEVMMKEVIQYYGQQKRQVLESRKQLMRTIMMKDVALFAEIVQQQEGSNYQSFDRFEGYGQDTKADHYKSFAFYTIIALASIIYMWASLSHMYKCYILKNTWTWFPISKALAWLKTLLGSVMVIKDPRQSSRSQSHVALNDPIL